MTPPASYLIVFPSLRNPEYHGAGLLLSILLPSDPYKTQEVFLEGNSMHYNHSLLHQIQVILPFL